MARRNHGNTGAGAVDLKSRIQGFGNGPEPPPLPIDFWGSIFGDSPTPNAEEASGDSFSAWYDDTVKGFEDMLNDIAEEMIGEPLAEPRAAGQGSTSRPQQKPRNRGSHNSEEDAEQYVSRGDPDVDAPGRYRIVGKETFLSSSVALGGQIILKLQQGEELMIDEVVSNQEDGRVRGRCVQPEGWISLVNMETGYRWAERVRPREHMDRHPRRRGDRSADITSPPRSLAVSGRSQSHEPSQDRHAVASSPTTAASAQSAEELKVGDRVVRKGQQAVIISIDRSLKPPAYTVRMCEDGREIGSEEHLLQKVNDQGDRRRSRNSNDRRWRAADENMIADYRAADELQARPKSPGVLVDLDLLDISSDAPVQPTAPSPCKSQESAACPRADEAGESAACPRADEADGVFAQQKLQERLTDLQAQKKDAAAREDYIAAQTFKSEIEALQAQLEALQSPSSKTPALLEELLPDTPCSKTPTLLEELLPDVSSPSTPLPTSTLPSLVAPSSPSSSSSAPVPCLVLSPEACAPVALLLPPPSPRSTVPVPVLAPPPPSKQPQGHPPTTSNLASICEDTWATFDLEEPVPATLSVCPPLSLPSAPVSSSSEPWAVFQQPLKILAAPAMANTGLSAFDPLADTSAGYPLGTETPDTTWRGCAVPRGISVFDPMSDKNNMFIE